MAQAEVISPTGRDFLIAALDPMHDNQLQNLAGWPDVETAPSVNRLIKQSITLAMPTGGNKDVYFISWPWLDPQTFVFAQRANNYINPGAITAFSQLHAIGGISVYIVPSGTPFLLSANPDYQLTIDEKFLSGSNRVVGSGFEVVNTTADLYRQGQCCVWRETATPVAPFHSFVNMSGPSDVTVKAVGASARLFPSPPRSFASAMLLPGTRQWKAADGCYVVAAHSSDYNPATLPDYTITIVPTTEVDDSVYNGVSGSWNNTVNTGSCMVTAHADNGQSGAGNVRYARPAHTYPMHLNGAIFTGVSEQTTLTLSWNLFLETFPTPADAEILVLAKPSAQPDEMAMRLYAQVLTSMPVGVMASENPFGEWFAEVVSTITDFLTPGALALGLPQVAAISKGANVLSKKYLEGLKKDTSAKTAPSPAARTLAQSSAGRQANNRQPRTKGPRKKKLALEDIPPALGSSRR